jgi:glycosyltransferase involved in cell wall biosynthesis
LLVSYGDVADLAQAVVRLGSSAELRSALGQAGQAKARRQYDWGIVAPRFRELLVELVQAGSK